LIETIQRCDENCYNICEENGSISGEAMQWDIERFYAAMELYNNKLERRKAALNKSK